MTAPTTPLGLREGDRMEFKGASALQHLEAVGKSVAAFLNSVGGTLWIGVVEENEQAVALEGVPDVDRQRRRLEDYLTDSIEPPPGVQEVRVSTVSIGHRHVIRVDVSVDAGGKPYALTKRGSWRAYPLRVGARTRPMTREELAEEFTRADVRADGARARVETAWNDELKEHRTGLWVTVVPSHALALKPDAPTREMLDDALRDPTATRNRKMGWNFSSQYESFRLAGQCLVAGGPDSDTWTEVALDGAITFRAPLTNLQHAKEGELYPLTLAEYPASVLRFAAWLHERVGAPAPSHVVADLGLLGVGGMVLRPGTPGTVAYELHPHACDDDVVRAGPHELDSHSLRNRPDDGAWRLLQSLYAAMGLWRDQMPTRLYDEERGVLSFPK